MQDIVMDSDVLIQIFKYLPRLSKIIHIIIPPAVEKETRRANMIAQLIKEKLIEVKEFNDDDRREVYKLIKRRIKEEVGKAYLHGKLKKNAGEYEACYLAKKENTPIIVFDMGAWGFARTLRIEVYPLPFFPRRFIPNDLKNVQIEILEHLCNKLHIREACEELAEIEKE